MPNHCPREEELLFPDGSFDALEFCLMEDLGVRDVGVVGTTREVKDSPTDFEARLSELVIVTCVEGQRHTPVQRRLSHLGLQHADLQAGWSSYRIALDGTACSKPSRVGPVARTKP